LVDLIAFTGGLALVALAWRGHRTLSDALEPRPGPEPLDHHPSVTVIRPIKGLDPDVLENLRAGLDHGYPGSVETIFVLDDAEEPVVPLVHRAVSEYRASGGTDRIELMYCGAPPPGRTGKLNAMIHGLRHARGDLVAFVDSDVRADRDTLRVTVETLVGEPKAGSAAAPVVVTPPLRSLCDAASALLLNGLYSPSSRLLARRNGGALPFIMGQFMVLRREALLAIGNLEDVAGNFVDDIQIGVHMERAGFRNLLTAHPVEIIWFGARWRGFFQDFVRWMTFSRGFPWIPFKLATVMRIVAFFVGLIGAGVLAGTGHAVAALPWLAAAAVVNVGIGRLHEKMGGAPLGLRHALAPALVLLMALPVFVRVYTLKRVQWRGRTYALDASGRLAARPRA